MDFLQGFKPSADAVAATSAGGFTILSEKKLFLGQKVSIIINFVYHLRKVWQYIPAVLSKFKHFIYAIGKVLKMSTTFCQLKLSLTI